MNRIYIATSSFASGLVVLLFSLSIISDMRVQLKELEIRNMTLESEIDKLEIRRVKTEVNVIGTMYSPTRAQCDATPNITAISFSVNSFLFMSLIALAQRIVSGINIISSGSLELIKSTAVVEETSSPSWKSVYYLPSSKI